jgi:hypothetical protein
VGKVRAGEHEHERSRELYWTFASNARHHWLSKLWARQELRRLAMQKFVAEQNIHHFKALLAGEADGPRREVLLRMIAEEEAKLAEAMASPKGPSNLGSPARNLSSDEPQTAMIASASCATGSADSNAKPATSR